MKILFISNLFPDFDNPTRGQDNANLLHYLANDHEIKVLATRPTRNPLQLSSHLESRHKDSRFKPVYCNNFYIPKIGSFINHQIYYHRIRLVFLDIVTQFNPDVVLCSWSYPDSSAVVTLSNEVNLPVVSIVQGSDAHIYMYMPIRALTIQESLSHADYLIPRSYKLGSILSDKGISPSIIHPIYNGVDKSMFHTSDKSSVQVELGLDTKKRYLLYVGNFYTVKNPQLLVKSFNECVSSSQVQDLHLLLVGVGYLKEELDQLVLEMGISKNITFLGRKTSSDVAKYMQASDLLCIPSFNEGLPNVLLEALSCGLPVVSTNVGGISEVLFDSRCGTLVNSFDTKAYSGAIISRLSQETDSEFISDFSEQYSWPQTIHRYNEILSLAQSRTRNECT